MIFVTLPVKDLKRSVDFFTKLGYTFNPQFTDEKGTCMIVSDNIFVMLLVEPYFRGFIKKDVADSSTTAEVILGLTADSRAAVDEHVSKAVAAGATTIEAATDYGFMYQHGFQDLDGHLWSVTWMDPNSMPQS
jgi:predicted lactoylglutathione lyase